MRSVRTFLCAGAAVFLAACSAPEQPLATGPLFEGTSGDGTVPSIITLCKIGPEGTWADFSVSANGGTVLVTSPFRLAATHLDDAPDGCIPVWQASEPKEDPDPTVTVSITEVDMTPGLSLDQIIVLSGLDGTFDLTGTNVADINVNFDNGATVFFKNSGEPDGNGGGQGCTPGYWKQPHHFDRWTAPYTPSTPFSDVFVNAFPGMTLLDVLKQGGGKLKALGRHTVAALLNAASGGVDYDVSEADVIAQFNAAFAAGDYEDQKDEFEGFNEQGCPLN